MSYNNLDDFSLDDLYSRLKELSEKILAQEKLKTEPQYVPPVFSRESSNAVFSENKADNNDNIIIENISEDSHDTAEKNDQITSNKQPGNTLSEKLSAFRSQIGAVLPQQNTPPEEYRAPQTPIGDDDDDILQNLEKIKQLIKELE